MKVQLQTNTRRRIIVSLGRFALPGESSRSGPKRHDAVIVTGSLQKTASPKRILVVEDNLDSAHSLALLLADLGHTLEYAVNGYFALAIVEHFRPDVVLLDLGLPGIDGFEVCARIKRNESLRMTRVIALTAFSQDDYRARAAKVGIEKYLVKPVALKDLEDALR